MTTPKMQLFHDPEGALAYAMSEIVATLHDDLERMENSERQHYTDDDRDEMRARIADIEAIAPLACLTC
jgi:uncharacterized protein (DUF1786 family)